MPRAACRWCGHPMTARSDARTCSAACRQALSRARRNPPAESRPAGSAWADLDPDDEGLAEPGNRTTTPKGRTDHDHHDERAHRGGTGRR